MTHPSGLQYSYDDLDLVCCHGVDSEGPWMGAGASKQGRRMRCASMPEGCHRLPTEDGAQTLEQTALATNEDTESDLLMESNVKVPLVLCEKSVLSSHEFVNVDIPQGASESEHIQTTIIGNSGEFQHNSNSGMSTANISFATDSSNKSEKTIYGEGKVGTESGKSLAICNHDTAFKSPHILREVQQCISISSNNGLLLSESAGEQPGKLPNHQETKTSNTEGDCSPPEISEASLNQSSTAELEPQTDLPDLEEEAISTSGHADSNLTIPVGLLHSSDVMMESGGVMSQDNKTEGPAVTLVKKGANESWREDSAENLDGFNNPVTLNGKTGPEHDSQDTEGEFGHHDTAEALDDPKSCEVPCPISVEQPEGEETVHWRQKSGYEEGNENADELKNRLLTSSDISVKDQHCSLTTNNAMPSAKQVNSFSEGNPAQISSQCPDTNEQTTFLSESTDNPLEISDSKDLTCCEDLVVTQQENSTSKLDTIPEVGFVEPNDTPALDPLKSSDFTQSTDVLHLYMNDKPAASEQHLENLLPCKVKDELSLGGLHGNKEASGCCSGESPASEVADGQREHRRPGTAVSRMEVTDEEAQSVIYSDTQRSSQVFKGTDEPGDQRDDNVVKVRTKKPERARLDSMVLLLMKLDQLDQEIENALSATSSMDSTPILQRRQLQEFDERSVPAGTQNPTHLHSSPSSTSGPTGDLGAKPKSGVSPLC